MKLRILAVALITMLVARLRLRAAISPGRSSTRRPGGEASAGADRRSRWRDRARPHGRDQVEGLWRDPRARRRHRRYGKAGRAAGRIDPRTPAQSPRPGRRAAQGGPGQVDNAREPARTRRETARQRVDQPGRLRQARARRRDGGVGGRRRRIAVENARIRSTTPRSARPSDGTILYKKVERGQVISSPTMDVGGGHAADDHGGPVPRAGARPRRRDRPRQDRSRHAGGISVASYPGKRFSGTIEKIEPQAVVEQNVTLFPVLISLANEERLLRPGMNVDVRLRGRPAR